MNNCFTVADVIAVLIGLIIGLPLGFILFNRFNKYGSGKWEL